jgi:hypothetical protein
MSLDSMMNALAVEKAALERGDDPTRIDFDTDPIAQRITGWTNHGGLRIDVPYITEISTGDSDRLHSLFQGGCEIGMILPKNIKHVVSLYPWERYVIKHGVLSETYVKMFDSEDQMFEQIDALAAWVNICRQSGDTLVHCQAGLNRSSLVAGRSMILLGYDPAEVVEQIRVARSDACLCNPSFEKWLLESNSDS